MFTKPLLLVALLVAVVQVTGHFTSGGDFCTDEKNRKDTCKPLVNHAGCGCSHEGSHEGSHGSSEASGSGPSSGSGSGSGSGEESSGSGSGSGSSSGSGVSSGSGSGGEWESGEYCFLLQFFLQISVQLDVQIQEIFVEWINITQITIVEDVTLTEYEILVKIWYSLTILFEEHFEIEKLVRFAYIPNWGYGCDLEGLAIDLQTETTQITIEEVITLGGSNNSCPLLDALEACGNEASSSDSAKIQVFISQLKVIIKKGFSFSETLVLIYEQFQIFFQANPSLLALINSGEIEEFGILQSYIDICTVYWRIKNFSVAVGGSTSNCSLINGLYDLWTNTSFNISQRSDFKQLWNKTLVYFQSETDVKLRLTYFVEQVYQFLILEEWDISEIYQVEIEGYGTIYQLIYAYIYCTDNGIGSGEFTGGPEETTTTTTKTSTSTKTSTTTTKPTTTTTVPNGNCNTIPTCNALSNNVTILITAIQNDQQTPHWNATLIATFKGYLGSIWRYSSNTTATELQKFTAIKGVLTGFTTKADFKAIVYAIFIQGWGTIQEYITCTTV